MFEISKDFHFSASHSLVSLPPDHKCHREHGHNYIVRIVLATEGLNEDGFVLDYGQLWQLGWIVDEELDHRNLNDVLGDIPTSAEHIARWIYYRLKKEDVYWLEMITAISISETPKTWATYHPNA